MSSRPEPERRGSFKNALASVGRRFSLPRRESYDKKPTSSTGSPLINSTASSSTEDVTTVPLHKHVLEPVPPSPSARSSSVQSSARWQPLLNSSSPASELPKTWAEWNTMYAAGLIDFNDPPPPPDALDNSTFKTVTGQYRAPRPLNETKRQRAVDAARIVNHARPSRPTPLANVQSAEEDEDGEEAGRSTDDVERNSSDIVEPIEALSEPLPRQLDTLHPVLKKLAHDAQKRFGTSGSTVSLMDGDKQVFLAEEAFGGQDSFQRDSTVCSHSQLKASCGHRDPLVVLNLAEDWRFTRNNFGEYTGGFYAAAPIMLPAPMGDDQNEYAAGLFCIIDPKPRKEFSEADRLELENMADEASSEIKKYSQKQEAGRRQELGKIKVDKWKRSKLVRQVSEKGSLPTVSETTTPPQSPPLVQVENGVRQMEVADEPAPEESIGAKAAINEEPVESAEQHEQAVDELSETGSQELGTTEREPTYRRKRGRTGVHAVQAELSTEIKSVFDLSTQLVGESLDLDFCYVVAVDLPAKDAPPVTSATQGNSKAKPIRILACHNLPIPAPLFDVELHLETLLSRHNALVFTNPEFSGNADGSDFASGLLVKIAASPNTSPSSSSSINSSGARTGYILAGYSSNPRRVLSDTDYAFMKSFARDLTKWVAKL